MHLEPERTADDLAGQSSLLTLALVAFLVGAASGLVAALFRRALDQADRFRDGLITWAHGEALAGFVFVIATCAAAPAVAAWLVRCFAPQAEGSGIPHVEAVVRGELPPAPLRLIRLSSLEACSPWARGSPWGAKGPRYK